jgi:hypothetical protein
MTSKLDGRTRRLVFLSWILVAFFYFYISYDFIRVSMAGERFGEYLDFVVKVAGNERRSPKEIRELLVSKADELGFELDRNQIQVKGIGETLDVSVVYQLDVDLPIVRRGFYAMPFVQKASYRAPR